MNFNAILSANHLTDRVAKRFAESLRENRTLWHLDLGQNEIGEQGAVFLGAGLVSHLPLNRLDSKASSCITKKMKRFEHSNSDEAALSKARLYIAEGWVQRCRKKLSN